MSDNEVGLLCVKRTFKRGFPVVNCPNGFKEDDEVEGGSYKVTCGDGGRVVPGE